MESRINHAFTPTNSQTEALKSFSDFLKSEELRGAFILRGAAGTGKSTITREFIALARSQRFNVIPMAPTGRAASVLAERVGKHTSTIHRCIYDLTHVEEVSDESEQPVFHFSLRANEDVANTLYIVDEASLISDEYQVDMNLRFGSGHLLKDLIEYCFWATPNATRKLLFVGDHCQLPPVGSPTSAALDSAYLANTHRLKVTEIELTDVVRQSKDSCVLHNVDTLRKNIVAGRFHTLRWKDGVDFTIHKGSDDFHRRVAETYARNHVPMIVCYKNATVASINKWVREDILQRGSDPVRGDLLQLIRNNKHTGLVNGDFLRIDSLKPRKTVTIKGVALHFREVDVVCEKLSYSTILLENALYSTDRTLSSEEDQARWIDFKMRHAKLKPGTPVFREALLGDPYWNCLICKYGYATTCHKAQGGEWDEVFIAGDLTLQGRGANESTFRWLYTALTRARRSIHFLNPPTFSPGDALRAEESETSSRSAGIESAQSINELVDDGQSSERMSRREQPLGPASIEAAVASAASKSGMTQPKFLRHQHCVHATWKSSTGDVALKIFYGSKLHISSVLWELAAGLNPPFEPSLLEAEYTLLTGTARTDSTPTTVADVLRRMIAAAERETLFVSWTVSGYTVKFNCVDPMRPELGVLKVTSHFDGKGSFSNRGPSEGHADLICKFDRTVNSALGT
jgi:hypothetical protein